MPRKPKAPLFYLQIEPLSGVKSLPEVQATFRDDFSGSIQPMNTEALIQLMARNPKIIHDYRKRERVLRMIEEYLVAKRYTEQRDAAHKLIHDMINPPKPEPKLAHNQVLTQSGLVFTPKRGPNALKRRF